MSGGKSLTNGLGGAAQMVHPTAVEGLLLTQPLLNAPSRTRQALVSAFGLWGLALLIVVANSVIEHDPHLAAVANRLGWTCVEAAVLCFAADQAWSRWPAPTVRVDWAIASVIVILGSLQSAVLASAFYMASAPKAGAPPLASVVLRNFGFVVWLYVAWAGVRLSLALGRRLHEQEVRTARAAAAALQAQNAMLRYQINPHFLFNTLNALATLILDRRNEVAERLVIAVGGFLRFSLEQGPQDRIPLAAEIAAQDLYLGIERVRFGDRLVFSVGTPERLAGARVPSMILQPLVENAIKYAVAPTTALVRVSITSAEVAGRLQITVEDTGSGVDAAASRQATPGLGVGLGNVRARLGNLYGDRAELVCERIQPQGFRARVIMPL